MFKSYRLLAGVTTVALAGGLVASAQANPSMSTEFDEVGTVDNAGYAGGLWVDSDVSDGDDVFTNPEHNFTTSNPDFSDTSNPILDGNRTGVSGSFHYAAIWQFEVTGSSGNDWDAVAGSGNRDSSWLFKSSWNGSLLNDENDGEPTDTDDNPSSEADATEIPFDELFFADHGSYNENFGKWVQNDGDTPGQELTDVWTYLDIDTPTSLTGSTGTFAVVARDDANVLGLRNDNPIPGSTDDDVYGAYISAESGTGSIQAVPMPASVWMGLSLLGLVGGGAAVRRFKVARAS